ncbi:LolA family protein [Flaviaesturariibacter aridisoli]|uniref:Outer membrane lipoprotein carrier protein LolA n=1 Tax=Flaviaesturariibacter aridisoli TaxID=2545761 RepID=A0A4R4E4P0_9BACT|nr:outer membrane lipoprotein carrier protein LolA [Flaviaesturariibacter aridisoli]TCZ74429.1 outer membrane lipoprotein carrier protein LolA [Flaviaesturariibacter aridisoli]
MKKMVTLMLGLATISAVNAQKVSSSNPVSNDPAAKKILDAVSTKFRTFRAPSAAFTYKIENAQGKALSTKKGTVIMKGTKYHVTIPGMELFSDGKTSWSYDRSANEVTVKDVDAVTGEITPQKLFTNFYDKDFLYKLNGEKKEGGKTLQEIELTPTNKTRPYHKVYLWVDKSNKVFYSAKILNKDGNRFSYTVSSLKPDAGVTDAEFVFNKTKFPGVEVVDLR